MGQRVVGSCHQGRDVASVGPITRIPSPQLLRCQGFGSAGGAWLGALQSVVRWRGVTIGGGRDKCQVPMPACNA